MTRWILTAAMIVAANPALAGWQRSTFETRNEHKRYYPQPQDQQTPQTPADKPANTTEPPPQTQPPSTGTEAKPAEKPEEKGQNR